MTKLFFVVPVYNVEAYLERCVKTLVKQTYENIQIVLVDDGSRDKSGAICDEMKAKYDKIEVIHQKNGGLSAARNTGIEYCLGVGREDDFIAFIDSDDFVAPAFGEVLIGLAEKYRAQVVQCSHEKGSGDEFSVDPLKGKSFAADKRRALLGNDLKTQTGTKIYMLGLYKEIRYVKNVLNEDEFTTYKVVYEAENVAFTTQKLYYYYQRSSSIMYELAKKLKNNPHKNDVFRAYDERYEFFKVRGEKELMLRTKEKVCTDIILRYSEQMNLEKNERDYDVVGGEYMRMYRKAYGEMIKRQGIPLKRRLMFTAFYILPVSAYWASRLTDLRK